MTTYDQMSEANETGNIIPNQPDGIPGWQKGIPIFRIYTCGSFTIEMLVKVQKRDPTQACYVELPPERLSGRGSGSAQIAVKLLLSQGERYASKDWLCTHLREEEEVYATNKRLENIISHLRCHLLCLPSGKKLSHLLTYVRATNDSGDGYRLAEYPLVWVDVDALAWYVKHACLKERFGEDPFVYWQRAFDLASRGTFLLEEAASEWARPRREVVNDHLRQAVHALVRLYLLHFGQTGEEDVLRILQSYSRAHQQDEDILRCLLEILNKRGRYQEVLEWYERLKAALNTQGPRKTGEMRMPSSLTAEIADFARLKLQEYQRDQHSLIPVVDTTSLSTPHVTKGGENAETIRRLIDHPRSQTSATPEIPYTHSLKNDGTQARSGPFDSIDHQDTNTSLNPQSSEQLLALADSVHTDKPASGDLHHFAVLTQTCRQLSEGNELRIAERILWTYLPEVEALATLTFEHQPLAAAITSQGYLLAASLAGHRHNFLERLRYSKQALLYGKRAQDRNLQVVALRQIAISFDCMKCPEKVLYISQGTLPLLSDVSPLLRACIYAGISGAYAQLKQRQEAERFIGLAYEHFPEKPEIEPDYLHTICRYSTLVFFDGLNYLDLGQPREAEKILARIDGLHPKISIPTRVRVELLNYQVEVFIALHSLEQACTYLETAAYVARAIGSIRHFHESFDLFQRIKKIWQKERCVQQLESLFIQ